MFGYTLNHMPMIEELSLTAEILLKKLYIYICVCVCVCKQTNKSLVCLLSI